MQVAGISKHVRGEAGVSAHAAALAGRSKSASYCETWIKRAIYERRREGRGRRRRPGPTQFAADSPMRARGFVEGAHEAGGWRMRGREAIWEQW